jgi:hypothetical protein
MGAMTRTRLLTALATTSILLLGACGSSEESVTAFDGPRTPASTAAPTSAAPTSTPTATTATPSPTAATSSAPAAAPGKLISYAAGEDSGIILATAADTAKLTGAPADFKSFVAAELTRGTVEQGCTEKPQISVDLIDTGGWARGGHFTPECGGYATLWAKSGGTWREAWSGQSLVECSTLTKFRFPARVAGKQCLQGDDAVAYTG